MIGAPRAGAAGAAAPRPSRPAFRRFVSTTILWTTVLVAFLALSLRYDPLPAGLIVETFPNTAWSGHAAARRLDPQPSTDSLTDTWQGSAPAEFTATWTGDFLAFRGGRYTFSTVSDDGSWVYIDGRLVVDNGGLHGPQAASGAVDLTRGVHAIFIRYVQAGGGFAFDLQWARDGATLQKMPAWALAPRRVGFGRFLASVIVRRGLQIAEWIWFGALAVFAASLMIAAVPRVRVRLEREHVWPELAVILAASALLILVPVWWGLPGGTWAPDEVTPAAILAGAAQHFSHGWNDPYPPFHFYVLTAVFSPVLLLQWLGRADVHHTLTYTTLAVMARLVSVAAGVGTVAAVFACGARAFGRRAGLFAAASFALVAPFLYYAKTTNLDVPYLFWFALSLFVYLRLLDAIPEGSGSARDFVAFATCATLSVCTKDQAYGLFLLMPLPLIHVIWRANREAGVRQPFVRALVDRRLVIAAATAVVVFALCHNLLFNWDGFVAHVRDITGTRSTGYRMFAPTIGGRLALLSLSTYLVRISFGWPLFVASLAGIAIAAADARYRRAALWLAVPVVSYYAGLIDVVLYTYDRFMLPICLVLALFAGVAFDRLLDRAGWAKRAVIGAIGLVFAYTLLYAGAVDILMLRDSRYTAERWLAAHVTSDDLVAFTFPLQYYPRLEPYRVVEINTIDHLTFDRPAYFLLDADYARAERPDSTIGRMIRDLESGAAGYQLAFRYRTPAPWPWLPGAHPDLAGARSESQIYSSLHHINPTMAVFRRNPTPSADLPPQ